MAGHSPLLIALIVINFIFFIFNQIFSFLNMVDLKETLGIDFVLFNETIGDQSDRKFLEITPSSGTFSIWGVIYIWQVIWMIYAFANICRRTTDGPVYTSPILLSKPFFLVSIFNWCFVITWTFVWSWGHIWVAFAFLALTFLSIYTLIGLSYSALAEHRDLLVKQGRSHEIWMVRLFVQNGLAIYGTWCTIATLLNLAMALTYDVGPRLDQSISSTIFLSLLAIELMLFVLADMTWMDKYSRYTVTPYLVIITALTGSVVKNWNPTKNNSILTGALLAAAVLCFLMKVVVMFVRHCRDSKKSDMLLPTTEKSNTRL